MNRSITSIIIAGLIVALLILSIRPISEVGYLYIDSKFQPVQVVWPSDPFYGEDVKIKRLKNGDIVLTTSLDFIANKNTLIFGWPYSLRKELKVVVKNFYLSPKTIRFAFSINDDIIYISQRYSVPPAKVRGWRIIPGALNISLETPIPRTPFKFTNEGEGVIELKTLDTYSRNKCLFKLRVVRTSGIRIYFIKLRFPKDPVPLISRKELASFLDFLAATYPIPEGSLESNTFIPVTTVDEISWKGIRYKLTELQLSESIVGIMVRDSLRNYVTKLSWIAWRDEILKTYWDRVVAIVPHGWPGHFAQRWAGNTLKYSTTMAFMVEHTYPCVLAHELGHTFDLSDEYHLGEYGIGPSIFIPEGRPAYGFWVNKLLDIKDSECFMGTAAKDRWICKLDYKKLVKELEVHAKRFSDKEVLGVCGYLFRNGSIFLEPFYLFKGGVYDRVLLRNASSSIIPLDARPLDILYEDGEGRAIRRYRIFVGFRRVRDFSPFCLRIPFNRAAKRILILDPWNDKAIFRDVSDHPPTIKKIVIKQNLTHLIISWKAFDPDGDQLFYGVNLSLDGGKTWIPLVIDLRRSSISVPLNELKVRGRVLIGVIATDGVNTSFRHASHDLM